MNENKICICPFYHATRKGKKINMWCEAGKLVFLDEISLKAYQGFYCSDEWEDCSLAVMLEEYYERTDK